MYACPYAWPRAPWPITVVAAGRSVPERDDTEQANLLRIRCRCTPWLGQMLTDFKFISDWVQLARTYAHMHVDVRITNSLSIRH